MKARQEIADFLSALLTVYVIVIIAWVLISFVFAMGVRVPYSRWSNAVLDFLRDTANPWLNLFRRLPLRVARSTSRRSWRSWSCRSSATSSSA